MRYVLGINGSSRKNWNTAKLVERALDGAAATGAETEMIHLVDLKYSGCMSCFACKRKGAKSFGYCILQDDLKELLEKIFRADAVIFGQPIYYWDVPGRVRNLFERIWFPPFMYQKDKTQVARHGIGRIGLIYTCNIDDPSRFKYIDDLHKNQFHWYFPGEPQTLWVTDTLQYEDYSVMVGNQFDPEKKKERYKNQFPRDLRKAFDMGMELATGTEDREDKQDG